MRGVDHEQDVDADHEEQDKTITSDELAGLEQITIHFKRKRRQVTFNASDLEKIVMKAKVNDK